MLHFNPDTVKNTATATAPMTESFVLSATNLTYVYGGTRQGVQGVSFSVKPGEFFCLLGPSGCGKTTLLRIAAGLIQPQAGTLHYGFPMKYGPGGISMMFQDLALFPHMSAARNVSYGLRHLPAAERRTRADEYLDLVGLLDYRRRYPHELSGGQKQRLALARALAPRPALLLLDEPFGSQDVYVRTQLRDELLHLLKEKSVAALMVTHDPEEAMFLGDRIGIMKDGQMHQIGKPHDLYLKPKDPYVAGFFGALNTIQGVVNNGYIDSHIGIFPAAHLANGTPVDIVIRPQAISLKPHDETMDHSIPAYRHAHGKIIDAKTLGSHSTIHLDGCDALGTPNGLHFHVRTEPFDTPLDQQLWDVFVDTRKAYIFPHDRGQSD